jgi:hypothetical protein
MVYISTAVGPLLFLDHRGSFIVVLVFDTQPTNQFTYILHLHLHVTSTLFATMPKGGCACGNVRLNYTGEPSAKVCLLPYTT